MRRALLSCIFSVLAIFTASTLFAQRDRFAYAITDLTKDGSNWNALRKLDLQTGAYSTFLFDGTVQKTETYDAMSKKVIAAKTDAKYGTYLQAPFSTGVAATAYDKKHNRLYFTPMFIDELRYIDLKTMKLYTVTGKAFTGLGTMHNDEAKCVTRMVIAPDGTGYAITNDGNTFIKFTTGKNPTIIQMGALVDDPANNGISIHNRCSSFGGDMIADDRGNLYILSARNNVFKVSTDTKVATYLGAISGLPSSFTVNGAVVDAEGSLLVSSAVDASAYYVVDSKSWKALPYPMGGEVLRSSDLANSNYLSVSTKTPTIETIAARQPVHNNFIQIYPNPVVGRQFTLQFSKVPTGDYVLEVTDVMGRS
ncbi:MAG TPA: hypothetical protein VM888_05890, partial [Chitinophagaceae bacterium]|nr:hypothetical protein [Chitinophagaceae bacterium]